MNRAELIEEVRTETGLTKKVSREAVDAIISAIMIPWLEKKELL